MSGVLAELKVVTPILAPMKKECFTYRLFSTYDWSKHVLMDLNLIEEQVIKELNGKDKNIDVKELVEKKKEEVEVQLNKKGFVKLDYIFPRVDVYKDTKNIDWFSYFAYPIRVILSKKLDIKGRLVSIEAVELSMGVRHFLYTTPNKKIPVFYEAVLPNSKFKLEIEVENNKIPVNEELNVEIGAKRSVGYGRCVLKFLEKNKKRS